MKEPHKNRSRKDWYVFTKPFRERRWRFLGGTQRVNRFPWGFFLSCQPKVLAAFPERKFTEIVVILHRESIVVSLEDNSNRQTLPQFHQY